MEFISCYGVPPYELLLKVFFFNFHCQERMLSTQKGLKRRYLEITHMTKIIKSISKSLSKFHSLNHHFERHLHTSRFL
jgi:hypothetical protein